MIYFSRRNHVELINGIIMKQFSDSTQCAREADMLLLLAANNVLVPKVFQITEFELKLEYIDAPNYVDVIDTLTREQATALGEWMIKFREVTGCLRGDVNLRNFLYFNGQCWGIDFEDACKTGKIEIDLGRLLAFAATYSPAFSENKANAVRLLYHAFMENGAKKELLHFCYLNEIHAMKMRRNLSKDVISKAINFWKNLI